MSKELDTDELIDSIKGNKSNNADIKYVVLQLIMLILGYGVWEWPWFVSWFPTLALVGIVLVLLVVFLLTYLTVRLIE